MRDRNRVREFYRKFRSFLRRHSSERQRSWRRLPLRLLLLPTLGAFLRLEDFWREINEDLAFQACGRRTNWFPGMVRARGNKRASSRRYTLASSEEQMHRQGVEVRQGSPEARLEGRHAKEKPSEPD